MSSINPMQHAAPMRVASRILPYLYGQLAGTCTARHPKLPDCIGLFPEGSSRVLSRPRLSLLRLRIGKVALHKLCKQRLHSIYHIALANEKVARFKVHLAY